MSNGGVMSQKNKQFKSVVESRIERAKTFSEKVKNVYKKAYEAAIETGKERLDGIAKARESIEPRIRSVIDQKIQSAHAVIDDLNQSLAKRSMPDIRKSSLVRNGSKQKVSDPSDQQDGSDQPVENNGHSSKDKP